ncbi:MAG: hypothetical protein ACTSUQ_05800 [Candidatus Freyarchaeota archaeon]
MDIEEYLTKVEKRIYERGKAVSYWYETQKNVDLGIAKADLAIKGNMKKTGGLVLAKMSAAMTVPDWDTAALFFVEKAKEPKASSIQRAVRAAKVYMAKNDITWAWVGVISQRGFTERSIDLAKRYQKREIAIFLIDLKNDTIITRETKDPVAKNGKKILDPSKVVKQRLEPRVAIRGHKIF